MSLLTRRRFLSGSAGAVAAPFVLRKAYAITPQQLTLLNGVAPSWVPRANGQLPTIYANFATEATTDYYWYRRSKFGSWAALQAALSGTFSRASSATDLLYTAAVGASYNTYSSNVLRFTSSGILLEGARANLFLQSGTPATQSISVSTGTYVCWVNGTGSATTSAGTATGSGFGAATNGAPNVFTITGAGSVTVTVSGSLNVTQVELGSFASSYIPTTITSATRAADNLINPHSSPTQFTEYLEFVAPPTPSVSAAIWQIDDGTNSSRIVASVTSANVLQIFSVGGPGATLNIATLTPGSTYKVAFAMKAGSLRASINGSSIYSAAPTGMPSGITTARYGAGVSVAFPLYSNIVQDAEWLTLFATDATLQSLTAP